MKSILERIRKFVSSAGRRNPNRAQPEPAKAPPERTSGIRSSFEHPYAEMQRVLAITMLHG